MMLTRISDLIRGVADGPLAARIVEVIDRRSENRIREFGMLAHAFEFKRINGVKGDYFEFGLWRGKTFRYAHRLKKRYRLSDMKLWGFDSFEGLPAIDDEHHNVWHQGEFAYPEEAFRRMVRRAGFKDAEFELVKGFYETSLNDALHQRMAGSHAAIVYIDCDLYTSAAQALRFTRRYLVEGSVLCFDEYWGYRGSPDQGEQKALRDFLAENPSVTVVPWLDYAPLGKSFIVRTCGSGPEADGTKEEPSVRTR